MPLSNLTSSEDALYRDMIADMAAIDIVVNPLTESHGAQLAHILNSINGNNSASHLWMSHDELLAGILNALDDGAGASQLRMSTAELLAAIANLTDGDEGGGGYVAKAVHFDGATYLWNDSLVAVDGPAFSYAMWVKLASEDAMEWFTSNPDVSAACVFSSGGGALNFKLGSESDPASNSTADVTANFTDAYQLLLFSFEAGEAGAWAVYRGDDLITPNFVDDQGAFPFSPKLAGVPIPFGSDTYPGDVPFIADVADPRIMVGVSLLSGGIIPEATRRLFIDENGKPVDPAIATAALGAPTVLFSGDETTFGDNQGSGGAFVLRKEVPCAGRNGPGAVTLTGAEIGDPVYRVFNVDAFSTITSDFETTISVSGQIQQTGATDYSGKNLSVALPGALTNASTSPSD